MPRWNFPFRASLVILMCLMTAACTERSASSASPVTSAPSSTAPAPASTPAATATRASVATADADSGCSLLAMADVAAALGEPVVANNKFGCEFDSVQQKPFKMVRFIDGATTAATFEAEARKIAAENGGADSFAPVSGVGDAAFSWHDDQGSARLDIRKGSRKVEIWVDLGVLGTKDLEAKQKIALQLGTVALGRMGASAGASTSAAATVAPGGASASGAEDPCTLVTKAEVQAALGVEFQDGQRDAGSPFPALAGVGHDCYYPGQKINFYVVVETADDLRRNGGTSASDQLADSQKGGAATVPGIGDGATWDAGSQMLYVAKNGTLLMLYPEQTGGGADVSLETAKSLALKALSRL